MRYADVLLLYAEALNEWKGGPTTDAYAAVNKVRKRGYTEPDGIVHSEYVLKAGMDQAEFRKAIQKNVHTNWLSKDIAALTLYVGESILKPLKKLIMP